MTVPPPLNPRGRGIEPKEHRLSHAMGALGPRDRGHGGGGPAQQKADIQREVSRLAAKEREEVKRRRPGTGSWMVDRRGRGEDHMVVGGVRVTGKGGAEAGLFLMSVPGGPAGPSPGHFENISWVFFLDDFFLHPYFFGSWVEGGGIK